MADSEIREVLARLGLGDAVATVMHDARPHGNANWLVRHGDRVPVVLRRYHDDATVEDLVYEHEVLLYLASQGWIVAEPLDELLAHAGAFYCLTRYVPGSPRKRETPEQRRQRGADLARLHLALRPLRDHLGQRPGWRPQHTGITVHRELDWDTCLDALGRANARLARWLERASANAKAELAAIDAHELPVTLVHGDFAEWNVHYEDDRLAGVIDFGLTHVDSRPYELAIARTYRVPEMVDGYRAELAAEGWPLSELEEQAIKPVYHAFRVDMALWFAQSGQRSGVYDEAVIEGQLARSGVDAPDV